MYSVEIQVVTLMQELSLYKIQHRRKTIQKLVSIFGGMLDKGEKWAFLEDKFPKTPFQRRGCRIVRLGDSRERKKRPHLVKKLNHKSIKEGIQMKQNRIFDQNSSQKARSWHYNMDTNRAEAQFADGSAIAIDCLAIEDEYGNTPAQRAELDWLLYNKPLECVQLVLSGEIEHYLSLGCDHGKLKD